MLTKPEILPVIHHLNDATTRTEVALILGTPGVAGVFLISHNGARKTDMRLLELAAELVPQYPQHRIGVNLLAVLADDGIVETTRHAIHHNIPMLWADDAGVDSRGPRNGATHASVMAREKGLQVFAGVAFKYQPEERDPPAAAAAARDLGFIPTTSGTGTGIPPLVTPVRQMGDDGKLPLAVASGMDPYNVSHYAPWLSHILVATGISKDKSHVDERLLKSFVAAAHRLGRR